MRTRLSILLVSLFVIACGSESSPKSAALATSVVAADFIGDWEMCYKDGFQLGEDLLYKKEEIFKLWNREITRASSLTTFYTLYTYPNMSFHNHRHIICPISYR